MNSFAKGLPIGLLIGALLGFGLWKTVKARRARESAAAAAAALQQSANSETASATSAESEKLKKEIAELGREFEAAKARLAGLKAKSGPKGGTDTKDPLGGAAARADKNPWSSVGRKLFLLRDKLDGKDGEMDPEVQALWAELIGIVKNIAEENGLDMREFELSPLTLPLLMAAMLDAADIPPSDAQSAILDAMMEKAEKDGKALAEAKGSGTALERRRDSIKATGEALDAIWDSLTPEQQGYFSSANVFGRDKFGRPNSTQSGDRASVVSSMTSNWKTSLGLDDTQAIAIQPLVDDYVRRYEEIQADEARRIASGEKVSPTVKALAVANLMIDAQKKVGETVRLSEAQAKALKNWNTTYGVEVTDPK